MDFYEWVRKALADPNLTPLRKLLRRRDLPPEVRSSVEAYIEAEEKLRANPNWISEINPKPPPAPAPVPEPLPAPAPVIPVVPAPKPPPALAPVQEGPPVEEPSTTLFPIPGQKPKNNGN